MEYDSDPASSTSEDVMIPAFEIDLPLDPDPEFFTIADEIEYWAQARLTAVGPAVKAVEAALSSIRDISRELEHCRDWSCGVDLFDGISLSMQNLWQLGERYYTEERLRVLLDAISFAVIDKIEEALKHLKLWLDDYLVVERHLTWGIALCGKMSEMTGDLTRVHWPEFDPTWREYNGGPYINPDMTAYWTRLTYVLRARTIHRQLLNVLTVKECPALYPKTCFLHLKELDVVCLKRITDESFENAYDRFEHSLVPVEAAITSRFRATFEKDMTVMQRILEFKRYEEILMRPKIMLDLHSNREHFLVCLSDLVEEFRERLDDKTFPSSNIFGYSQVINDIYSIREMDVHLKQILDLGTSLLRDLSDFPDLYDRASSTRSRIRRMQSELFDEWLQTDLSKLRLFDTTKVIEFNEDSRLLQVNYNPELRKLIDDVYELGTLGFRVPDPVNATVILGSTFLKQARELDQIACFHNTIGDRMIPCLRPMLLDTAMALSRLVSSQDQLRWEDPNQVGRYIVGLQDIVHNLGRQNNHVTEVHFSIKAKIYSLYNVDIVAKFETWKHTLRDVRQMLSDVEAQGYRNLRSWKVHWDRQLYKVLEVSYVQALEFLNTRVPGIPVELVFREHQLRYKPALAESMMKYLLIVNRIVTLPLSFVGVNDDNPEGLFGNIMHINIHRFREVYLRGEKVIGKLLERKEKFIDWVALGTVEVDAICVRFLRTARDWENNFRVSRTKGQEITQISFTEESVGPFRINFGLLRMEIELLNRKYADILTTLLQNSILSETTSLEKYLTSSNKKLQREPMSIDDISDAKQSRQTMISSADTIRLAIKEVGDKNKVLGAWSKERINLSRLHTLFENFTSLLENHEFVIDRQIRAVKVTLTSQVAKIMTEVLDFKIRWDQLKPKMENLSADTFTELMLFIKTKKIEWKDIMIRRKAFLNSCTELGIDVGNESDPSADIDHEIRVFESVWVKMEGFHVELTEYLEEEWIIFRTKPHRLEEFLLLWEDRFKSEDKTEFVRNVIKEIESYKKLIPNLKYIRGDTFSEKHWFEVFQLFKMPVKTLGELKVKHFIDVRNEIGLHFKELKELTTRATGELTVRQALNELDVWEMEASFSLSEILDSQKNPMVIIEDFKSVLNRVGDNQSLLHSMKSSQFFNNFSDRISGWESRLTDTDHHLQCLNKIQRRWIYLEPIFSHGVLDMEQTRFQRIDRDFRRVMATINSENRVSTLCKIPNMHSMLLNMLDQLGRCQSSLNEFLQNKRSGFPRFYFLGDDDLLEILGQSTNPSIIQAHLKKLFAGIYNVDFDQKSENILAMKSLEGEIVVLKSKVKISTIVENWLSELANEMKDTLKAYTLECVEESKSGTLDPDRYPSQILSLCNSVMFTVKCEEAIRTGKLESYLVQLMTDLESYTDVEIHKNHPNPRVLELKLKELILDIIHEIDIVEVLIAEKIGKVNDWTWQKQLRFYIKDEGVACVRMADAEFNYSYEYQGNAQKLVHTPLTDKCYLTLTQGMKMGLGGNPYGPAGTGKTESVKALGGLLGRQVLVFNCDEGIDVKSMGRIFVGLVKCGAWGCFDEFNRLEGATLSAVSMQIQPIQTALKSGHRTVQVLDEAIPLDPSAGIFVTLNPAGKGYGGRNKLPDNLKQLFRPVVMSSPNNDQIAEVILYTEGFKHAKRIGCKLVEVFTLSSRLLTPQKHYDWGLRALKTVLKGCGSTLREFKKGGSSVTEADESDIVVSALRLNTLPKLTYTDSFRFDQLVRDLFANVTFKDLGDSELTGTVRNAFKELRLQPNENQIRKCLELYEQLQQRMGVVIVGPPCCGKSTICTILKHALVRMKRKMSTHVINPKAMTRSQLLGHINVDTRQWTDGVLTLKAQQVYNEPPDVTSWIICDGDIDPEWVESLNSVLDDNRLLTLPSGWRIKFGPNVNFIFETHDLSYASPATISRMGMILMSEEDTDVKGIINAWMDTIPDETRHLTLQLIEDYFHQGLKMLSEYTVALPLPLVSIVKNGLSHMVHVTSISEMAVAMIRGFSAHLVTDQRVAFAKSVLSWTNEKITTEDVLNLVFNRRKQQLEIFSDALLLDLSDGIALKQPPLVKTANAKQILATVRPWLSHAESFIVVGPEGCGKTMILEHAFNDLRGVEVAKIHCSSLISPEHVLQKLSQVCITTSSATGRVYKAKSGGRLILYFKDINLVKPDKWGTCQLVEFLQQIIKYNGFFDKSLEWVGLSDVQIVASINAGNSGGRHNLSPRFTSIVRLCSALQPVKNQLIAIYRSYLTLSFITLHPNSPLREDTALITQATQAMILVFEGITKYFTRTKESHYQFTPRDLTNWVLGIMKYEMTTDAGEAPNEFASIWAYEARRLFRDKMVSVDDKSKFDQLLQNVIGQVWSIADIKQVLSDIYYITAYARSSISSASADFGAKAPTSFVRGSVLAKVSTVELNAIVERGLQQVERDFRDMQIVTFTEVLENVAHFDRILSSPSSLVLAGRAGIGRRTALHIVAALHGATIYTLKVGQDYGLKHFKTDLKNAIQMSAVEGSRVFFIVEDFQLIHNIFLDMLNGLISSGDVPGLYSPEELENVMSPLREVAAADGYTNTLFSYFSNRVMEFLHVILIMDYTNNSFQINCESNPVIYKQCSLVWLDAWSHHSLITFPRLIMKKFYEADGADNPVPALQSIGATSGEEAFLNCFGKIYSSLSPHLASPRRYVAFVHTYAYLYYRRRLSILEQISQLRAGVNKLDEARSVVEQLKANAASQEVTLAEKQYEASQALNQITLTMRNANVQRAEMEELRKKTLAENDILLIQKASIDEELKSIQPLVLEAQAAVGSIKNEALTEIRSLRAPPEAVRDILEGVLRLMGIQDMSWNSMKTFLAQRGVKDMIRNVDARKILLENRKAVEALLQRKGESFEPKNAKRASSAAAPLAAWVKANVKYSQVLEKIEPLTKQQQQLESNLVMAEDQIQGLSDDLTSVDQRVESLKVRLNQNTKEAAEIEIRLDQAKNTLQAAEGLVGKLYHEFTRWNEQLIELGKGLEVLSIQSVLASAFITYLSDAPEDLRTKYVLSWLRLLSVEKFDFREFVTTEQELLTFQAMGLPPDDLSQENALIIMQTCLRPYLIDPSSRATEWLKKYLEQNQKVVCVSLRDPRFSNELELAVRFGKVLIIFEADEIEPILIPILRADLTTQGSRDVVQIADKVVDYNPEFRLYMTTRNPNPRLMPDSAAVVTIVNFSTTKAGLTTQLLTTTLSSEKPELEHRKATLLERTETLKGQLSRLGALLLKELAGARGNILENQDLLNSLQQTKQKSMDITAALEESSDIEEALNKEINVYLPLAEFGSRIFFAILDVPKLSKLYTCSLSCFVHLFSDVIEVPDSGRSTADRIQYLQAELERSVYHYVCRYLFKEDRLAFALHISHAMHPECFQKNEWDAFAGQMILDQLGAEIRSLQNLPRWIAEDRSYPLSLLSNSFPDIYAKLRIQDTELWAEFARSTECENYIPAEVRSRLTPFQTLMTIQTLRPDRLQSAMTSFARVALGRKSLFPPPINFREILKDTRPEEPILILIGSGADPSQELRELAEETVGSRLYYEISMGQDKSDQIISIIHEAAETGKWVTLKNIHLVIHWLDTLEKEIQRLKKPNRNFRLWLTTEPNDQFPAILAESCLKIAYEAPQGVKKNLQRTYTTWSPDYVIGEKNVLRMQTLFALAFFHAIVQERRTYIPQGWSRFYEFNESDLRAGADVLDRIFKASRGKQIQWDYLHGLYENAIYGGRVDNVYDSRVLVAYLQDCFNDSVLSGATPAKKQLSDGIQLPKKTDYQEFMNILESLPDYDKPSMFGLPGNIERSWQKTASAQVITQLKVLARKYTDDDQFNRGAWLNEMGPILNLWKKVNQESETPILLNKRSALLIFGSQVKYADPIEGFVRLEQQNVYAFIQTVHLSLSGISKVTRGLMGPTPETLLAFNSLVNREPPEDWRKVWEGPSDPALYIHGLVQKHARVAKWVEHIEKKTLLMSPLNLSDLINPASFMSAFKQHCARTLKVPMDELGFVCGWKKGFRFPKNVSCQLTGLYLEGCAFNGETLVDSMPESPPIARVPDCTIAWVPQGDLASYKLGDGDTLSVPLYNSSSRQSLIGCLEFPAGKEAAKWIKAGVGLFLIS